MKYNKLYRSSCNRRSRLGDPDFTQFKTPQHQRLFSPSYHTDPVPEPTTKKLSTPFVYSPETGSSRLCHGAQGMSSSQNPYSPSAPPSVPASNRPEASPEASPGDSKVCRMLIWTAAGSGEVPKRRCKRSMRDWISGNCLCLPAILSLLYRA